ncbi:LLM class flavin-dependent oxidoreductase [Kitasatospora sp. NPDC056138]|uniref:LLM class flavin-dependent oxidoreductase n=1 Tax=Kitasatospora sp. NPDC056138 TaxID=3345724 RepID=UPI0035D7BD29
MSKITDVYGSMQGEFPAENYVENSVRLASLCEKVGFSGALVHFNHRVPDPWQLSSLLIQNSQTFVPMVAVQPYYMPPFALAKTIASISFLNGRRVALNMVAGSTPGELRQVGDTLDHDARFKRMDEYLQAVGCLLSADGPIDHEGPNYRYRKLRAIDTVEGTVRPPKVFIAGSSDSAKDLCIRHRAVAVTNPSPVDLFSAEFASKLQGKTEIGIRIGLIARETREEAWSAAKQYFPPSRVAYMNVKLNGRASDSVWRKGLSDHSHSEVHDNVYWLGAFLAGGSHSPFLVGTYEDVAEYLGRYVASGVTALILASPWEEYESNADLMDRAGLRI